ncbi:MAG: hypothetical protein LBU81_03015 [Methanosarcinales archaeon]|jgi:hypothetical protein|nr:hypothetical protein [Methanosarcinales archaeon]
MFKKRKCISHSLFYFSVLAILFLLAGTAAAETIEVSDDRQFRAAIEKINGNGDSENTIVLLNDIKISEDAFTETDYNRLGMQMVDMNFSRSGNLTIRSDSSDSRRVYADPSGVYITDRGRAL